MTGLVDQITAALAPYSPRARFLAEKVLAAVDHRALKVDVVTETVGKQESYRVAVAGDASPILVAAWLVALEWSARAATDRLPALSRTLEQKMAALVDAFGEAR
jgi:hypothetical protein